MRHTAAVLAGLSGAAILRFGARSGATRAEAAGPLDGDDLVALPRWQSTRAITVRAAPDRVWPWIAQMGFPTWRAGWYTPFWLDRLMWGIEARSADRIVPELQTLAVGDRVPDSPDRSVCFVVARVDPGRALVLHSTQHLLPAYRALEFSWAFALAEHPRGTRLVVRARVDYEAVWSEPCTWLFVRLAVALGDLVNVSWMLRGIRRRAERASAPPVP